MTLTTPSDPPTVPADPAVPTVPADDALSFEVAGRFVDGVATRDFDLLAGTLEDGVHFRALLPRRVLDVEGADAVRAAFVRWFGGAERWEMVEAVVGEVGGRVHLRWRVRLTDPGIGDGPLLVEQQAYANAAPDGRLRDVALLCTGFRPVTS